MWFLRSESNNDDVIFDVQRPHDHMTRCDFFAGKHEFL